MAAKSSSILFFAYGAHMATARMTALDPACEKMGLARADGQRLSFTADGYVNLLPQADARVWGVLWLVPAPRMADLDAWARSRGLRRSVMFVVSPAGPRVPATAYFDPSVASGAAAPGEVDAIVAAARDAKLDRAYVAEVETLRS